MNTVIRLKFDLSFSIYGFNRPFYQFAKAVYSWYSRVQYFKKSISVSKFIFTLIQFKSILENDYIKVQSILRYDI